MRLSRLDLSLLLSACGLAALVSSWRIGAESYWFDETFAVEVSRDLALMRQTVARFDPNMAFYHLLLRGWMQVFGDGEAAARSLSALSSVGTTGALFLLGRRLVDRRVGAAAALLFALHPFARLWAQEARGYAQTGLLVTLGALALVAAVEKPAWWRWGLFVLASTLAFYTHFVTTLAVGAQLVSLVALPRGRIPWKGVGASIAVLGLAMIPGAVLMTGPELTFPAYPYPTVGHLLATLYQTAVQDPGLAASELVLLAVGLAWLLGRLREHGRSEAAWRALLPFSLALLPPVALSAAAFTVRPELVPRYFFPELPALALVLALGWSALSRTFLRAAVGLALASLCGLLVWQQGHELAKEDWSGVTAHVLASSSKSDGLLFFAPHLELPYHHYLRRMGRPANAPDEPQIYAYPVRGPGGMPPFDPLRLHAALAGHGRTWLVIGHAMDWLGRGQERDELEAAIARGRLKLGETRFRGDLRVLLFQGAP
jgi:mannosyltransferase